MSGGDTAVKKHSTITREIFIKHHSLYLRCSHDQCYIIHSYIEERGHCTKRSDNQSRFAKQRHACCLAEVRRRKAQILRHHNCSIMKPTRSLDNPIWLCEALLYNLPVVLNQIVHRFATLSPVIVTKHPLSIS